MSSEKKVKKLLLESFRQDVARKALSFLTKTKKPEEEEYDLIALRNISYMFAPREYERVSKDWEFATGSKIPVSLQEALDYIDENN
tara:strand:- start:173 stop:430 length:258 start_codon:yes stop_codon:yes gene_type:complete